MRLLTKDEYDKIARLTELALSSHTKAEAKKYSSQLAFFPADLHDNIRLILSQLRCAIDAASGQVSDKENKCYYVQMELSKLDRFVMKEL